MHPTIIHSLMDEYVVNSIHPFWKIMYVYGGEGYGRVWEQYGSPK
jgi:hypothetical protein